MTHSVLTDSEQRPAQNLRYVVHDEGYVSKDDVHANQAECLWSLLQP